MRRPARFLLLAAVLAAPVLLRGPEAHGEDWMFDPRFHEGRPGDVLVEGPVPLLRTQLDAFVELTEAAFDLRLPADAAQALRDAVETAYAAAEPAWRQAYAQLVAPAASLRHQCANGGEAAVGEGLSAFRRGLDERMQARPDHVIHRGVEEALTLRQTVVWPGIPPVHATAAEAWMEVARLLTSIARNEAVQPTAGQHAAMRDDLARALHGLEPDVRKRVREAHRLLTRLQLAWDDADDDEKARLRWIASGLARDLLPAERQPAIATSGDAATYARAAARLREEQGAFEVTTAFAASPEALTAALAPWLESAPPARVHLLLCTP